MLDGDDGDDGLVIGVNIHIVDIGMLTGECGRLEAKLPLEDGLKAGSGMLSFEKLRAESFRERLPTVPLSSCPLRISTCSRSFLL